MAFSGFVDSDQLTFLTKALDEYCNAYGIIDTKGRNDAAVQIMLVYANGATTYEEVIAALDLDMPIERIASRA